MKNSEFNEKVVNWVDRFITTHDRDPKSFEEFIQFTMDTLVDEGEI